MPIPGAIRLVGEPRAAQADTLVQLQGSDGAVLPESHAFARGRDVIVDRSLSSGGYTVLVNGVVCSGVAMVEADRTTEVAIRLTDGGCEIATLAAP